jgi:hypothetical protein
MDRRVMSLRTPATTPYPTIINCPHTNDVVTSHYYISGIDGKFELYSPIFKLW